MGSPYTAPSISGYNDNPPADDGSSTESNRITWAKGKTKLSDPIKTLAETDITATLAAFAKIIGGGGVTSSAISYQVLSTDQGKLVNITGASVTVTTPSATDVTSPFVFGLLNSSSGTITLDGSGSQTVNGVANITIPVGGGCLIWTDGSNWFAIGLQGVLAGKQLMHGDIINGTITESNATNAVTFAVKTLAGNDPSTDDPVLICFRNATAGTGNYVYRTVTAALSLTIPFGAEMGAVANTAFNLVLALFDDGGTIRLGAINPFGSNTYYFVKQTPPIDSSTTIGTGSDSAKTWYTNGAGVTSKPYVVIAIARYSSGPGLVTPGTWNVPPTTLQLYGHGVPIPGEVVEPFLQVQYQTSSGVAPSAVTRNTWNTVPIATSVVNEISGASLPGSSKIRLPAGIYYFEAFATASCSYGESGSGQGAVARLRDTTTSATLGRGNFDQGGHGTTTTDIGIFNYTSSCRGRFTLSNQADLEVQIYPSDTSGAVTFTAGKAADTGETEVHAEACIWKIG